VIFTRRDNSSLPRFIPFPPKRALRREQNTWDKTGLLIGTNYLKAHWSLAFLTVAQQSGQTPMRFQIRPITEPFHKTIFNFTKEP
jgi:hypothetical protein